MPTGNFSMNFDYSPFSVKVYDLETAKDAFDPKIIDLCNILKKIY